MKKVFLFLALIACVLSCRSVMNEGTVATHHYGHDADTLSTISHTEKNDSSIYFHMKIDSLSVELQNVLQRYHELYVRDSINENTYRHDSVSAKDTTWFQINDDGSITYHHYRERNTYSYQQVERYKQQIMQECKETIDSLTERNERLQMQCDSMKRYVSLVDSVSEYRAKIDSLSSLIEEHEKVTVVKNSLWDKIRVSIITTVLLIIIIAVLYAYLKFFRR